MAQRLNLQGITLEKSKSVAADGDTIIKCLELMFHSKHADVSSCFYRVTVTFNVNNSIPPNFEEEAEQGQQKSAEEEVSHNTHVKMNADVLLS